MPALAEDGDHNPVGDSSSSTSSSNSKPSGLSYSPVSSGPASGPANLSDSDFGSE